MATTFSSHYNYHERSHDPHEEVLLETNFEGGGVSTRAYNSNIDNVARNHRSSAFQSIHILDRYNKRGAEGMIK